MEEQNAAAGIATGVIAAGIAILPVELLPPANQLLKPEDIANLRLLNDEYAKTEAKRFIQKYAISNRDQVPASSGQSCYLPS